MAISRCHAAAVVHNPVPGSELLCCTDDLGLNAKWHSATHASNKVLSLCDLLLSERLGGRRRGLKARAEESHVDIGLMNGNTMVL